MNTFGINFLHDLLSANVSIRIPSRENIYNVAKVVEFEKGNRDISDATSELVSTYKTKKKEEKKFHEMLSNQLIGLVLLLQPAEIGKTRLPAMSPVFEDTNNANESSDGILSFIPAALRETLWTTMALYLGWRLVSRLR